MTDASLPMLSLSPEIPDPTPEEAQKSIQQTVQDLPYEAPNMANSQLTDAERKAIEDFIGKIDVTNPDHILLFGAEAQKKVANFSDTALEAVQTQDPGEVGDMLIKLVTELKGFDADAEQPKGLRRLFAKPGEEIDKMKARYAKVSTNVESIANSLEGYQAQAAEQQVCAHAQPDLPDGTSAREWNLSSGAYVLRRQSDGISADDLRGEPVLSRCHALPLLHREK